MFLLQEGWAHQKELQEVSRGQKGMVLLALQQEWTQNGELLEASSREEAQEPKQELEPEQKGGKQQCGRSRAA